jgi:hypothetical protein
MSSFANTLVIGGATVYLTLFISIIRYGGLDAANQFLANTFLAMKSFGYEVKSFGAEVKSFGAEVKFLLVSFGGGLTSFINQYTETVTNAIATLMMAFANTIVCMAEGLVNKQFFLMFSVGFVMMIVFLIGLILDRESMLSIAVDLYPPISAAVSAIWGIVSVPSNLIQFAIFYVLVSVVPKLPAAMEAAVTKSQKVSSPV